MFTYLIIMEQNQELNWHMINNKDSKFQRESFLKIWIALKHEVRLCLLSQR